MRPGIRKFQTESRQSANRNVSWEFPEQILRRQQKKVRLQVLLHQNKQNTNTIMT